MKRKMKLTDLRQVETSKEEMGFVKGGNEQAPICIFACSCECKCTNSELPSDATHDFGRNSTRDGSGLGKTVDVVIAAASVF